MPEPNPQQAHIQEIEYESKEGHKYREVHGDPEQNLEVKSKAEQEGAVQPNLVGTTPDPHNPELTDWEKERRGEVEEATAPGGEEKSEQQQSASSQQQEQRTSPTRPTAPPASKQADKPTDK